MPNSVQIVSSVIDIDRKTDGSSNENGQAKRVLAGKPPSGTNERSRRLILKVTDGYQAQVSESICFSLETAVG